MAKAEQEPGIGELFWTAVSEAVDPSIYKPHRVGHVEAVRLRTEDVPYYVIKQPEAKTYLRLSEADYALWWQMDGSKTVKDLLFYNLKRYHSLPIGHLNSLVASLYEGFFFQDTPTNIYCASRGRIASPRPIQPRRTLAARLLEHRNGERRPRSRFHHALQMDALAIYLAGSTAAARHHFSGWRFICPALFCRDATLHPGQRRAEFCHLCACQHDCYLLP